MNKKRHHSTPTKPPSTQKSLWLWLVIGSAILLIAGGLGVIWSSSKSLPAATPAITGAPRLAVDQTIIDEGYAKLDTPIRTTFRLRNVGDQPLQILGEPVVELVEGC